MSEHDRIPLAVAKLYADSFIGYISPLCDRIEVAGSIRRQRVDIGDIEIVAIPRSVQGALFLEPERTSTEIKEALTKNYFPILKAGDRYIQTVFDGFQVDLFLATPETWGCVFTIRTGSAEFTHKLVTKKSFGGYCPNNLYFKEARIWDSRSGEAYATPEEADVFELLGLEFIEPRERNL